MFSGIIERLAQVAALERRDGSLVLDIATGWSDLALGESVAVDGVCLTVMEASHDGRVSFFVSPETLDRSNLGRLQPASRVNLERAVRLETRLSGHLVQGHVDAQAVLVSIRPEAEAWRLEFDLPGSIGRYCVEKGSVTLNGVSLTLNAVLTQPDGTARVGVSIIPHTWAATNLQALQLNDAVNVEVDVIAKYVERLCQPYL